MNHMIIKEPFACRKGQNILLVLILLLSIGIVLLLNLYRHFVPIGGEIFAPDFNDGVDVYVEAGHSFTTDSSGMSQEDMNELIPLLESVGAENIVAVDA